MLITLKKYMSLSFFYEGKTIKLKVVLFYYRHSMNQELALALVRWEKKDVKK